MEKAVKAKGITKKYRLYQSAKERLLDLISFKSKGEDFYALTDINFVAEKGDSIGFIGINGSGKSTLSNIIAGIVPETTGSLEIDGQVSLIAVAAGLKNELTGRDNIELKLLMLGFNKEEIKDLEPSIIEFAELEKFIDQPVKSYSSGMKSRLGFAISVNIDPDIIIIDEALAVGDKAFAEKSLNKMKDFKQQGKTMIFVSHSLGQMKKFCDKILWLEFGKVKAFGATDEIMPKYEEFLKRWQKMSRKEREAYREASVKLDYKMINKISDKKQLNINNGHTSDVENNYREFPTSRVAHIKAGKSLIYNTPTDLSKGKSSESYKNHVYFIKKKATFNGDLFYLISDEPSGQDGVIGWMRSTEVSSHIYMELENDSKTFLLKGTGAGYNRAWGSKKNRLYPQLKPFADKQFKVFKTVKVGKNLWYCGTIQEEKVWIHNNHLKFVK